LKTWVDGRLALMDESGIDVQVLSVTTPAGLSQPAASRVLAQLRITLGDPLLVRGRQGNTLTPRGEGLQPAVGEAMRSISALFEREVFAPSTAKLIVRIATTDHGATVVLSPLVKMLGTFAPGITLEVTPWNAQTLHELETGRLDLALDSESRLPENFHARTLYQERSVCLVRQGHPLVDGRRKDGSLDPALASSYPQIVLLYPVGDRLEGDDPLARGGHPSLRIALRTPYFTSAPMMLTHTDHFMILPSRLGRVLADSAPLALIPLRGETPFPYRLIWHERTQKDDGLRWLRTRMYQLLN